MVRRSFRPVDVHPLTMCRADEQPAEPRKFLIDVDETLHSLLQREDTDNNMQITIEDVGPKVRYTCLEYLTPDPWTPY